MTKNYRVSFNEGTLHEDYASRKERKGWIMLRLLRHLKRRYIKIILIIMFDVSNKRNVP